MKVIKLVDLLFSPVSLSNLRMDTGRSLKIAKLIFPYRSQMLKVFGIFLNFYDIPELGFKNPVNLNFVKLRIWKMINMMNWY